MPIDRGARDLAAAVLERFRTGELTNYEFEDAWPRSSSDPALEQIMSQLWTTVGDTYEYRLQGERSAAHDELYRRAILFLKSPADYRWPLVPRTSLWSLLLAVLTLGLSRVFWIPARRRFRSAGDVSAWPLLTEAELRERSRMTR